MSDEVYDGAIGIDLGMSIESSPSSLIIEAGWGIAQSAAAVSTIG